MFTFPLLLRTAHITTHHLSSNYSTSLYTASHLIPLYIQSYHSTSTSLKMVNYGTTQQSYTINSTYRLSNGTQIPRFGLGTWRAEPGVVANVVKHAILNGYVHIDAAKMYLNQQEVATGIADALKEDSSIKRSDLWITSKLWNTHHEPSRAREQIDDILNELQVEYLDLLLIHWPVSWKWDGKNLLPDDRSQDTSHTVIDTWRVMEEYVRNGKLRCIGVSNFNEKQVDEILENCEIKPVINQCESHPYFNNVELQHAMEQRNISFVAYSPLGNVSGKITESPMSEEVVKRIAKKYRKSAAQVIIRWHLQSNRVVIPKSSKPERAVENSEVFDFQLSDDEIVAINELHKNARSVNPEFYANKQKVFPEGKAKL